MVTVCATEVLFSRNIHCLSPDFAHGHFYTCRNLDRRLDSRRRGNRPKHSGQTRSIQIGADVHRFTFAKGVDGDGSLAGVLASRI